MIRPFLALLLCAAPVLAQGDRVATLGDRVKVYAPSAGYKRVTGQVVGTTPDVLSLSVKGAEFEVPVARAQIDRLLLSVGSHRNIARGAGLGGLIGLGGYVAFGPRQLDATALPRICRLTLPPEAIPDHPPGIQFVIEHAEPAARVARDRRRQPATRAPLRSLPR